MREASTVTAEASTGAQLIFIESFADSYSLSSNSEMLRYYCDYCDTYLMHDLPSVRKRHNAGHKHKANVQSYNQLYEAQLNQSLIDQKVKEHLRAFRPPVASNVRHGLPVLPTPLPGQL